MPHAMVGIEWGGGVSVPFAYAIGQILAVGGGVKRNTVFVVTM